MPQVIRIEDQPVLVPTKQYQYGHWPFEFFNPVQSRLMEVYPGNSNVVIASATSSGKTVSSEIYAANQIRQGLGSAIYIGPLKALAKEKEMDWTDPNHHFHDLKISICTGDYRLTGSRVKELDAADIILMTPEMLSSRIRNHKSEKSAFLKNCSCVIFDESHLITVPSRGDHIEVALMKFTEMNPEARIVFLSATMPNVDEICGWLSKITNRDTYFLESKYRPCPLSIHYETYYDGENMYEEREREKVGTAVGIVNYYSEDKFLVFVHTKRTGQLMVEALKRQQIETDFYNADRTLETRLKLEKKFKEDPKFRVLVSTSSLAWGCNLPARRVVIVGVDRGLQRVENYDCAQMCGRAGRPKYDKFGDAYILVPESRKDEMIAVLKRKQPIRSQLLEDVSGHHKTLAFHIVSEIHHGNVTTKEDFHHWFHRSLAYHQNHDFDDDVIDKLIDLLVKCKAVRVEEGEYKVTPVGMVASMFYFSPFDVADYNKNFRQLFENHHQHDDLSLTLALANIDTHRYGIVNKQERTEMSLFQTRVERQFGKKFTDAVIKVAFAYSNVLSGVDHPTFLSLQSGLRHDGDRTLEVLNALDSMAAKWGEKDFFRTLRLRMMYGVKPELVGLCQIKNVGKVRAEKLWKAKIKNVEEFIRTDEGKLSVILNLNLEKTQECLSEARKLKLSQLVQG